MSLKQLPLTSSSSPLRIPLSLPQLSQSTYLSPKNLSHSRYDNNHEKPSFQAPIPKMLSLGVDIDLEILALNDSDHSQEIPSYENVIPDRSPLADSPVKLVLINPLSPSGAQKPKQVLLGVEEISLDFEGKLVSPKNNGHSTPTIVKEIDSDLSNSEIMQVTEANQVETVVFEQRKPSTANVLFSTLVPSRFALDVISRNGLRASNEKSGDGRSKKLSGDEGNQSIGIPASPTAHVPKARKKWKQLSHVLHSITMIQKPEAANISQNDIAAEINNFQLRAQKEKFDIHDNRIYRREGTREAFDMLRTIKVLCDCAKIGGPKHIEVMKEILANDVRKHLYEPKDPDHLLNRYNTDGYPPLCLAAQNGNLDVVKMLIEKGADPLREIRPNQAKRSKDVALELAVRWNHVKVVEYLLEQCVHPGNILQNCFKTTDNKALKNIIKKHLDTPNVSSSKKRGGSSEK